MLPRNRPQNAKQKTSFRRQKKKKKEGGFPVKFIARMSEKVLAKLCLPVHSASRALLKGSGR